ncbi:MAG: hypothetical protein P1V21_01070 [Rhizobiaceae bacterium]|nr:hypothetical protein [Rhizobiaceae bacterium]
MSFKVLEKILESPGWKTLFGVVVPIIAGVLSGTFVAEVSSSGDFLWAEFYESKSFYGLLFLAAITFIYHRALYFHEHKIEMFLNDDYCRAYMRSKCLPEAADRYKELIRSGNVGELTSAMEEFERIMK